MASRPIFHDEYMFALHSLMLIGFIKVIIIISESCNVTKYVIIIYLTIARSVVLDFAGIRNKRRGCLGNERAKRGNLKKNISRLETQINECLTFLDIYRKWIHDCYH